MRKRGQWFWVSRDGHNSGQPNNYVDVWALKPRWDDTHRVFSGSVIAELCAADFYRYTGIRVDEGECKRVRLTPEVK